MTASAAGRCSRGSRGLGPPSVARGPLPSPRPSRGRRRRSPGGHVPASTCRYRALAEGAPAWLARRQPPGCTPRRRARLFTAVISGAYAGTAPFERPGHGAATSVPSPPHRRGGGKRRPRGPPSAGGHGLPFGAPLRDAVPRVGSSVDPYRLPSCLSEWVARKGERDCLAGDSALPILVAGVAGLDLVGAVG